MINWKNLEKFIVPGKVVTLVLLVDGEEVGAFSFNVDSLAFKETLEAVFHANPVKVAEKKQEPAKPSKKSEPVKPIETQADALDDLEEGEDEEVDPEEDVDSDGVPAEPEKPMTREQIMAQTEPVKPVEEKKQPVQPKLTDEW